MAVSTNKSKLIGIMNYKFEANSLRFKPMDRKTINFNKSIDKNSSICFSTELQPIKVYTQKDYENLIKKERKKTEKKMFKEVGDFSNADNMGDETIHYSGDERLLSDCPMG